MFALSIYDVQSKEGIVRNLSDWNLQQCVKKPKVAKGQAAVPLFRFHWKLQQYVRKPKEECSGHAYTPGVSV